MNNIRKKYQQKNQAISEMVGRVDKELDLGEGIQKMGDKTDAFKKVIKSLQEETEKCIMLTDDKLADKYFSSPKLERRSTIFEKQMQIEATISQLSLVCDIWPFPRAFT